MFLKKLQISSRNYDLAGSGFSPIPTNQTTKLSDDKEFCWNVGLIRNLLSIFLSIFLAAIAYGITAVMISLKLSEFVKNEILISISAIIQIASGIALSHFLPLMGRKFGMIKLVYFGSGLSAFCTLLMHFYIGYDAWLILIFFLGSSFFICGVTRNTIMIDLAPAHVRAIIISLGGTMVALGNGLGPILINMFKISEGFTPLLLAALLYLLATIPISRLKKIDSAIRKEKKIGLWRYIKNSPKIMFAGFSVSYAAASSSAFLIIYGLKIGMGKNEASLLLSIFLFGTIFSIPLGYLTDIFNRRFLMIFCATLSLIISLVLCFNHNSESLHTLLFFLFGALMGMKLPAIVLINEKYKPTQRLAVNSAFSRFSLIGNVTGLLCTGIIIKLFGPLGLWLSITLILSAFLAFCYYNYHKKFSRKELNFKNFSILNKIAKHEEQIEV